MPPGKGNVAHRDCPYFGLDYYEEKFGAWFFGREVERGQIITNLQASRLTLLHAESGVGKSSLLRAGVAWRLHQLAQDGVAMQGAGPDVPVVFSSWKDEPVPELIAATSQAVQPLLAKPLEMPLPADHLDTAIEAAAEAVGANFLIMLDQFEEYFLYCAREKEPERFADELARCINRTDLAANFLISIREDAYAGLGDLFNGRIANVYGNYLHVDYLDRVSAEKAIREPLELYNKQPGVTQRVEIQDELVEAVLEQARTYDSDGALSRGRMAASGDDGDRRVATPLLQLVMRTIWDRERVEGSPVLRLATLQRLEGVSKVVDTHLGQALSTLSRGERQTAIEVFDHLVTPSGAKIAESVPDLAVRTGHTEDHVGSVLEKLDHAYIVRPVPAPPDQDARRYRRYEIFHDVLASAINRTIRARKEQLRARRFRRLAALAVALLVVVTAIGIYVGHLYTSARAEAAIAQSRALAAAANAYGTSDPQASTLLALQALKVHYTAQAEAALREALPRAQEIRQLGSGAPVFAAAFDPADAGKVASGGADGNAWVWDARTGHRLLLRPSGGFRSTGTADTVAFNRAGSQVAVGYFLGTVAVFDVARGNELYHIKLSGQIQGLDFVGATGQLAIATTQGAYLENQGSPLRGLLPAKYANQYTYGVAADPVNPREFAIAGYPSTPGHATAVCNLRGAGSVRCKWLTQGTLSSYSVGFSPDGRELVTADNDGGIHLYNAATRAQLRVLEGGDGVATGAQFDNTGTLVVAGYSSGAVRVWNATSGLQFAELQGNVTRVNSVQFDANGGEIVTAGNDGTTRIWRTRPSGLQREFAASLSGSTPNPVWGVEYNSEGTRLTAWDSSGDAYVYTVDGHKVTTLSGLGANVQTAQFSPNGTMVATTTGAYVDQWHASTAGFAHHYIYVGANEFAMHANYSPDGARLLIVTSAHTAQVRDATTGKLLMSINPHSTASMMAGVFQPHGYQILTGNSAGQVWVWNADTGKKLRVLGKIGPAIADVEFNRSGSEFVTAVANGDITVWSANGDRRLRTIPACPSPTTASFSPDGTKIIVGCSDGTARVFATGGKLLTVVSVAQAGLVNTAEFSPNGHNIVTAFGTTGTGGIEIWSSELASRLSGLEKLAQRLVDATFTPAERAALINAANGPNASVSHSGN